MCEKRDVLDHSALAEPENGYDAVTGHQRANNGAITGATAVPSALAGCLVFSYRQLRDLPPVPISAQMAAILAQQQQQQQPSVPPGFHTPSPGPAGLLDNGSSDAGGGSTAVLVGAIVAGGFGSQDRMVRVMRVSSFALRVPA